MSTYCLSSDTRTQVCWGKAFTSLILLVHIPQSEKVVAPAGLPPAKSHFSEPGCSKKESMCAHASLHMSSISMLSSRHLPPPSPLSLVTFSLKKIRLTSPVH